MSRRPWPIAAALCVVAVAAVLITAPHVFRSWRDDAPRAPEPAAPGLAALSDQQLADLLPKPSEFPVSWTVKAKTRGYQGFGYARQQPFHDVLDYDPAECSDVNDYAVGNGDAAEVVGYIPADPPEAVFDPHDIRLTIGREFDRSGFDAMIALVSRCSRFTSALGVTSTVRILEDSRPANGPQRFRISVTETTFGEPAGAAETKYFSYARLNRLVLSGTVTPGNQQAFDALFENTLRRISNL